MKNIVVFGSKWREVADLANYKHEYLFKFLQISPSYQLAYRRITLKEKIAKRELPNDFDLVVSIYKNIGNVFDLNFVEWWLQKNELCFANERINKRLLIGVDITKSKEDLMYEFEKLVDKSKLSLLNINPASYNLKINKIRLQSLRDRHYLVESKAEFYFNKRQEEHWKLAKFIGIGSKWTESLRLNSKKTKINLQARNYLSILVSKNLKEALYLSENAARGNFPLIEKIETDLRFDFPFINNQIGKNTKITWRLLMEHADDKDFIKYVDPTNSFKKYRKINESTM